MFNQIVDSTDDVSIEISVFEVINVLEHIYTNNKQTNKKSDQRFFLQNKLMSGDIRFDSYKAYPSFVTLLANRVCKNKYVLQWLLWIAYSSIIRNYIVQYYYIIRNKIFTFIFSILVSRVWKQVKYVQWKLWIAHTHGF